MHRRNFSLPLCLIRLQPTTPEEDDDAAPSSQHRLFHRFVRPVHRPRLSPFCTTLTGITQAMVDEADEFSKVHVSDHLIQVNF